MITGEQAEEIKKQIISQMENFPSLQKEQAIQQINAMNNEQLEQFLIQNKLIKSTGDNEEDENSANNTTDNKTGEHPLQCIFCSIINNQTPSCKIDENKEAIAVLEINPVSEAHVLIIPKTHISDIEKLPHSAFFLAKKIVKKIKTKFKPKDVSIISSNAFEHAILNILPVYESENLNSARKKASEEELAKIQKKLAKTPAGLKTTRKPKIRKIREGEKIILPRRIP
ncbi:HIT domain-containing protein [Candidatus Pacearchaeota archaeon]|nr:HIT domain-containing protein [Candidatus Pacearchaeota archaeon]